ncbi:hypothetical protein Q8F55_000031 [Vanrija albida]|uniref:F-box domain-containing protein n=1 Tax=Vanrija albida TaxID=181172 RepID=A0ABR3QC96_9TREE
MSILLDSTAFPHVVERIIANTSSVSTLLAWRLTCKRYHAIADAHLFRHAVVRRNPLEKPTLYKRLVERRRDIPILGFLGPQVLHKHDGMARKDRRRYPNMFDEMEHIGKTSIEFTVAPVSGLEADAGLPQLPWKVAVLDIVGRGRLMPMDFALASSPRANRIGEDFYRLKDRYARKLAHPVPTAPRTSPLILRRFDTAPLEIWHGYVDTTVDFYTIGRWRHGSRMPPSRTYVRHAEWLAEPWWYERPDEFSMSISGSLYTYPEPVDNAILVLAQHCAPPAPHLVMKELTGFAQIWAQDLLSGASVMTFVGLEHWLPGVDHDQIKEDALLRVRDADGYVRHC